MADIGGMVLIIFKTWWLSQHVLGLRQNILGIW